MLKDSNFRIEICGGIAAGKTTLSKLIQPLGFTLVNENFESNPFLHEFYKEPSSFSFETELTFLLQHYHDIKLSNRKNKTMVCDFSLYLDIAYADITLNTEAEKIIFMKLLNEVVEQISPPDLLIYLECPPDVLLERIRARNREIEKNITIEYLSQLAESMRNKIDQDNNRIIVLNSDQLDFAYNMDDQKTVLDIINNGILRYLESR